MQPIAPVHFAQIMLLPQEIRNDVLEFLGACPVAEHQVSALIVVARQSHKSATVRQTSIARDAGSAPGEGPEAGAAAPPS